MIDPDRYELDKFLARPDSHQIVSDLIRRMKWRPNEKILDYGCGPGVIANDLLLPVALKTNSRIYGVDNSQEMIDYAVLRYTGKYHEYQQIRGLPPGDELEPLQKEFLSFHLGDIFGMFPFGSNVTFEKIFCIFVFHMVKNYREAIRELYRRLEAGGQLAFAVPSRILFYKIYDMLLASPKWNVIFEKLPNYIPNWMQKDENPEKIFRYAFEEAGFNLLETKTIRKEYTFEDADAAAEFGMSINPLIKKVQVGSLPELKEEYKELLYNNSNKFTAQYMAEGGTAKIDYDVLVMLVEKPSFGGSRDSDKDQPKAILGRDLLGPDAFILRESPKAKFAQSLIMEHGNINRTPSPSPFGMFGRGDVRVSPIRDIGRSPSPIYQQQQQQQQRVRISPIKELSPRNTPSSPTTPLKSILRTSSKESPTFLKQRTPSPISFLTTSGTSGYSGIERSRSTSPSPALDRSSLDTYKPSEYLEAILKRARASPVREVTTTTISSSSRSPVQTRRTITTTSVGAAADTDYDYDYIKGGTGSLVSALEKEAAAALSRTSPPSPRRYTKTTTTITSSGSDEPTITSTKTYDYENRPPIRDFVKEYMSRFEK